MTIQSPDRQYKALLDYISPKKIIQSSIISDKDQNS